MTTELLFVIGLPGLLIALFAIGLTYFAIPLLILALLAVFIWPVLKGI